MARDQIDLHTHTFHSDGTESVADLLAEAARQNLNVIGLTDHDTTRGWEEARTLAPKYGVNVVPGIEVSSSCDSLSVHLLAYLPRPADDPNAQLTGVLQRAREQRGQRARKIVERLSADYPVNWDDVVAQTHGASVGRPHIADALVAAGIVADRAAAFAGPLHYSSPYYVRSLMPDTAECIAAIKADGGVSVVAHVWSGTRSKRLTPERLEALIAGGLNGIEVDHREHDLETRAELRTLAQKHDLIVTGSSDYHGSGKPNVLGENRTAPEMLERLLELGTSPTKVFEA